MRKRALRIISGLGGVVAILAITPSVGFAQEYVPTTQDYLNNLWVFIAGVLVFISALVARPALALIYGDDPNHAVNGVQNIGRNMNTFAVVLPILAAAAGARRDRLGLLAASGLVLMTLFAALMMDNHSAVFAVCGMLGAFLLIRVLPTTGFPWLFGLIAGYLAPAPLVVSLFIRLMTGLDGVLPPSFRSRFWSW